MSTLFPSTPIEEIYSPSGFLSTQEAEPLTIDRLFGISAREAQIDSPTEAIARMYTSSEVHRISQGTEAYDPKKANEIYGKYGLVFNEPVTKIEADFMAKGKLREYYAREALARHQEDFASGAISFGGSIFGSLMDPIGIAASAIPITKAFPGLKAAQASSSAFNRLGVGFVDAAIGNAIIEPIPISAAQIDQRDYTVSDSMMNIFVGGLIGTGLTGLNEGIRYMSQGNKFNALATQLKEYSNSEIPTATEGIKATSPQVSSFTFDDLINMPDNILIINKADSGEVRIQLNDENTLGKLIGIGESVELAKQDLRQQYGTLLNDDTLIKGYNRETVSKKIEDAFFEKYPQATSVDIQKVISQLNTKEDIVDFIYHETNGLADLKAYINKLDIKEGARIQTTMGRLAKTLEDRIEDKVQEVAIRREARKLLLQKSSTGSTKELLRNARKLEKELSNPEIRQKAVDELTIQREKAATIVEDLTAQLNQLEADFALKQKQLDNTNKLARQNKLKDEIADLNRAKTALQNDIKSAINISKLDPGHIIRTQQERISAMKSVLSDLYKENRTAADIRNIIEGKNKPQHELDDFSSKQEFDTYFNELKTQVDIETTEVNTLAKTMQKQVEAIKEDNLYSKLGAELENEIKAIDMEYNKFSKDLKNDYKNYLDCRSTEGIS